MGARLRQLAGQSFVYGLGGIVSKLVGIFLLPIYTKPAVCRARPGSARSRR